MMAIAMVGCEDDPVVPEATPTGNEITYDLSAVEESGISGTATFAEYNDGSTQVSSTLDDIEEGDMLPVNIYTGPVGTEDAEAVISLGIVDGSTGTNELFVAETDAGDGISFNDLASFDGSLAVHQSEEENAVVAEANIGANALTGNATTFDFSAVDESGVTGTATLEELVNGSTLVTLSVDGLESGNGYPAVIYSNEDSDDTPVIALYPVDGDSGMSSTYVSQYHQDAGGDDITYEELIVLDGYINIFSVNGESVIAESIVGE